MSRDSASTFHGPHLVEFQEAEEKALDKPCKHAPSLATALCLARDHNGIDYHLSKIFDSEFKEKDQPVHAATCKKTIQVEHEK